MSTEPIGILMPSLMAQDLIVTFDESATNSVHEDEPRIFEQLRIDSNGKVQSMIRITWPHDPKEPVEFKELRFEDYNYPIIVRGKVVNKGDNTITKSIENRDYVTFQAHEFDTPSLTHLYLKAIAYKTAVTIEKKTVDWFDYVYEDDDKWKISGVKYSDDRFEPRYKYKYDDETYSDGQEFYESATDSDPQEIESDNEKRPPTKKRPPQGQAPSKPKNKKRGYRLKM
jgi:hypothetical protein